MSRIRSFAGADGFVSAAPADCWDQVGKFGVFNERILIMCRAMKDHAARGPVAPVSTSDVASAPLVPAGRPVDRATRERIEPRLGFDFSRVRVHADDKAGRSAERTGASAYTLGSRAVFARDAYAGTPTGASVGRPLDAGVRSEMERHLGHDFSSVRLHTGADGDRVTRAAGAVGVTVGNNIWLCEGQSADSLQGRLVLGHELAHVVQQRRGGDVPPVSSAAAHEADATTASLGVALGRRVSVGAATGVGVARITPEELERMKKAAEAQWWAEPAHKRGPGATGEGAYRANLANRGTSSIDLNEFAGDSPNFPHLDVISKEGVAQLKVSGDPLPDDAIKDSTVNKLVRDLRNLANPERDTRTEGGEARAAKAADLLLKNRAQLRSRGAWPDALKNLDGNLPREQQVARVLEFFQKESVLAVPSDQVAAVRAKVIEVARVDPERFGLKPGANLEAEVQALAQRVQPIGLKLQSLASISRDLHAGTPPGPLNETVSEPARAVPKSPTASKPTPPVNETPAPTQAPHETAPTETVVPREAAPHETAPTETAVPAKPGTTPSMPPATAQAIYGGVLAGGFEALSMTLDNQERKPVEFGARVTRAVVAGAIAAGATAAILPLLPAAASNPVGLTVVAGILIGMITYAAVTGSWDLLESALVKLLGGGGPPRDARAMDRLLEAARDLRNKGQPERKEETSKTETPTEVEERVQSDSTNAPRRPPPQQAQPPRSPPKKVTPQEGRGCFVGATRVRLANGTWREIRDVSVGDEVLAFHEPSGQLRPGRVTHLHVHPPEPCLRVLLDGDTTVLGVTPFHPVRSASKWIPAGTLSSGAVVERIDATGTALMPVTVIAVGPGCDDEPVYNLTVGECESYFADGILVHNASAEVPKRRN